MRKSKTSKPTAKTTKNGSRQKGKANKSPNITSLEHEGKRRAILRIFSKLEAGNPLHLDRQMTTLVNNMETNLVVDNMWEFNSISFKLIKINAEPVFKLTIERLFNKP